MSYATLFFLFVLNVVSQGSAAGMARSMGSHVQPPNPRNYWYGNRASATVPPTPLNQCEKRAAVVKCRSKTTCLSNFYSGVVCALNDIEQEIEQSSASNLEVQNIFALLSSLNATITGLGSLTTSLDFTLLEEFVSSASDTLFWLKTDLQTALTQAMADTTLISQLETETSILANLLTLVLQSLNLL